MSKLDELRLQLITSTDQLRSQSAAWDQLWQRSDVSMPSARAEIVSLWVDCFAPGAVFRALVVEQQGRFVGALPLVGQRFLRTLSAGRLPCNDWAASGELLLEPDIDRAAILDTMIAGLAVLPWKLFVFEHVPFAEPRWLAWRAALERAGFSTSVLEQHRVGQVAINHDWDAYEATRKSRHRQRRRRYARLLAEAGHSKLQVYAELPPEEVGRLLRRGFEVEDKSWKGRTETSVLKNNRTYQYYLQEASLLAGWGQLELAFLELNAQPIAFCYGWSAKGVRYCVKIGYDSAYAQYGPGQQQSMHLLERAHRDSQCRLYDFHGKLMPWNESWITTSYAVGRLIVTARSGLNKRLCDAYIALQPALKKARTKILSRFKAAH